MKKRLLLFVLFCMNYLYSTAQFYDRAWLVGFYGDIKLTYLNSIPDTATFLINPQQQVIFTGNGSNVSDTNGNILFMSNSAQVGAATGYLMDNGNGIMDSLLTLSFPDGFPQPNSNIILPKSNNQFYLFNFSESDSILNAGIQQADRFYYSVIDMNMDSGMGKVISKKNLIWNNGLMDDTRLTACRHANGRDWWLVGHVFETDAYFIYLVTSDSIYPPFIQHIGPEAIYGDVGQSVFSPDGSLYATALWTSPIVILDFDRCSGTFSYKDTIALYTDTIYSQGRLQTTCDAHTGIGCSFSPSGRFLYVSSQCYLMQYDMQADTISASGVLVARADTTINPPPFFSHSFLTPNGQIVMCSWEFGPSNFHLIQYPDQKAPACGFAYYGLATNSVSATSLPNMVNYRLGALTGSVCDTLGLGVNQIVANQNAIKVYPNPSSSHVLIGLTQYHKNARLYIYDALGNILYENNAMYLDDDVNVSCFASGIYMIRVSSADGDLYGRFVKE